MHQYLEAWRRGLDFDGRSSRTEYWVFVCYNLLFSSALAVLDILLGLTVLEGKLSILSSLYALAVFIPALAVTARRLQDSGKNGWMILIAFLPLVGPIWLLILLCTRGDLHENHYDAPPGPADQAALSLAALVTMGAIMLFNRVTHRLVFLRETEGDPLFNMFEQIRTPRELMDLVFIALLVLAAPTRRGRLVVGVLAGVLVAYHGYYQISNLLQRMHIDRLF